MFHTVALRLRYTKGADPVFAALAGGASITLYAALLASIHVYSLIEPGTAFILLAVVALSTMFLSLHHGPILALIGLVGGYAVPVLVNTGSGNIEGAMIYSLVISAASLMLMRYVFRPWIWWGMVAGSLGWWLIGSAEGAGNLSLYLALLAAGILVLPQLNIKTFKWEQCDSSSPGQHQIKLLGRSLFHNQVVMILILLAACFVLAQNPLDTSSISKWIVLVVVMGIAPALDKNLWAMPWLSLITQSMTLISSFYVYGAGGGYLVVEQLSTEAQADFLTAIGMLGLLHTGTAAWLWNKKRESHVRVSLVMLTPLAMLAIAYLRVDGLAESFNWSALTIIVGCVYGLLAGFSLQKSPKAISGLWLTLGGHVAYSLAVTMYFREAGLSLALAAQLLSLSLLLKRYQLPWMETLIKAVLAIVALRMTLNPFLLDYPIDVHWSIWTYGGATAFAFLASRQLDPESALRGWMEAATLHLLVLTLGTELRYWLYDGDLFAAQYGLTEGAINTTLWALMGLSYWHRASVSDHLKTFYERCGDVLLSISLMSYIVQAVLNNPWWSGEIISGAPVINILLLAYGAPVAIAAYMLTRIKHSWVRNPIAIGGALGAILFVSLEIRQLWQGSNLSLSVPTSAGELYTYSVVFMIIAIAAILSGARYSIKPVSSGGMTLLAGVVGKIFLIDMSGLDGLLRVASFMGLGLSMLAMAWFYQRIQPKTL